MKIAVVTDSASDIVNENVSMAGLYWVPLQIADGDKMYLESENAGIDDIYELIKQGRVLKTSLPPLGRLEDLFQQLKDEGYQRIFAMCLTRGLSSTADAMVSAAQQVDIPIDYVDCYSTAYLQLHLAITARKMFDDGKTAEEVKQVLQTPIENSCTYLIPDDLKHLSHSGRLSPLAATLAGFLKIKPILFLDKTSGGKIDPLLKTRTMAKAIHTLTDIVTQKAVGKGYRICIAHVDNPEGAKMIYDLLVEKSEGAELQISRLVTTVSVHTGMGCLAIQYYKLAEY